MDYSLHLGDCLEFMRTLPDGSVDAVVTDPPYGIGVARSGSFGVGENVSPVLQQCIEERSAGLRALLADLRLRTKGG